MVRQEAATGEEEREPLVKERGSHW
jgi:hypothetical protein